MLYFEEGSYLIKAMRLLVIMLWLWSALLPIQYCPILPVAVALFVSQVRWLISHDLS